MIKSRPGASSQIKKWIREHGKGKSNSTTSKEKEPGAVASPGSPRAKKEDAKKKAKSNIQE